MRPQLFRKVISHARTIKHGTWISVLGLMFGLMIAYGMVIHLMLVIDPQPIEYRESATLYLTHQLQSLVNIYDFKRQPYDLDVYGPAYYWIAAHFSPLLGTDFTAPRILSAVFIYASCALIIWLFRAGHYGMAAGLVAACVWYAYTLRMYGIGARPDTLALLLYLLSVFVPWRLGFSYKSIIFSAACSIFAFLTKPYLAAGIIYVIGYLLLRRHFRVVALTTILYAATFLAMLGLATVMGDAYIYNTIFVNLGYSGSWNWPHVQAQVWRFGAVNLPLLLCIGYAVLVPGSGHSNSSSKLSLKITGIPHDLQYLLFAAACSLAILLRIAHNSGSGEYFLHLLSPIILVAAYQYLASRGMTAAYLIAGILQVAILLPHFPHFHAREWQVVQDTIAKETNVLQSPTTVKFGIARGEPVYDSGQTEFFGGGLRSGEGYYPQAGKAWMDFQNDIGGRVMQREFSLVLLNANKPAIVERDWLRQYYSLCGTLPAPIYRNPENVLELWRPSCPDKAGSVIH